jgi:hypothetical protein
MADRTFNLVPGFECLPLQISLIVGESITVTLREAKI